MFVNTRSSLTSAAIVAAVALAGCSNTGNVSTQAAASSPAASSPAASSPAASSPAASATASSCESRADAWKNNGGASHIGPIVSDLSAIQKAADSILGATGTRNDLSSAESALQSAAASLQSDVRTAEAALPPACIVGVQLPYRQALADYSKTAEDFQNWVSELHKDSGTVALGDAQAGTNAMNEGDAKFDAANAALQMFINSQP
jgi:hypothetical protein